VKIILPIILTSLLLSGNIQSQEKGCFRISAQYEFTSLNTGDIQSYGLLGEYYLSPYLSLDYSYTLGKNKYNERYYHFPGAVAALISLFGEGYYYEQIYYDDFDDGLIYLSLILPEGIGIHTYPVDWLEVSPFIYPFGADYNIQGYEQSSICMTFGFRSNIRITSQFSISSLFGLRKIYRNGDTGYLYGFSAGLFL